MWVLVDGLRNERLRNPWTPLVSPGRLALLNGLKLTISSGIYLWRRRDAGADTHSRLSREGQDEEQLVDEQGMQMSPGQNNLPPSWQPNPTLRVWTGWSVTCICAVATLYVLRDHAVGLDIVSQAKRTHTPSSLRQ